MAVFLLLLIGIGVGRTLKDNQRDLRGEPRRHAQAVVRPWLASVSCDAIWKSPVRSVSTMPFTRTGDLQVYPDGILIDVTTPGAGAPNYGIRLKWDQVGAIGVLVGPKKAELRVLFVGPEGDTVAMFKADKPRLEPVVTALARVAPEGMVRVEGA